MPKKHNPAKGAATRASRYSRRIFIVHGRDLELKNDLLTLLARIEFEPYLSPGNLLAFIETWERYYLYRNHVGQNVAPGSIDVRKTETPVASKILEEILEFAKPR